MQDNVIVLERSFDALSLTMTNKSNINYTNAWIEKEIPEKHRLQRIKTGPGKIRNDSHLCQHPGFSPFLCCIESQSDKSVVLKYNNPCYLKKYHS